MPKKSKRKVTKKDKHPVLSIAELQLIKVLVSEALERQKKSPGARSAGAKSREETDDTHARARRPYYTRTKSSK